MPVIERLITDPHLSIFAALWDNGNMLGIVCTYGIVTKSTPPGPEIPLALQPTPLQLSKLHYSWIDRFPFPRMRDNMISLSGVFDEEAFLEDLFKHPSFVLRPGGRSYDPTAWVICNKDWATRWGFLFY